MADRRDSTAGRFLTRFSVLMYVAAFIVPSADGYWLFGTVLFVWGFLYCWLLPVSYSWYANVLFWVALRKHGEPQSARLWGFLGGLVALSFFFAAGMDEPGLREWLQDLPFMLWTGSMFLYAFANHLKVRKAESNEWNQARLSNLSENGSPLETRRVSEGMPSASLAFRVPIKPTQMTHEWNPAEGSLRLPTRL